MYVQDFYARRFWCEVSNWNAHRLLFASLKGIWTAINSKVFKVICSAAWHSWRFCKYFNNCNICLPFGRTFRGRISWSLSCRMCWTGIASSSSDKLSCHLHSPSTTKNVFEKVAAYTPNHWSIQFCSELRAALKDGQLIVELLYHLELFLWFLGVRCEVCNWNAHRYNHRILFLALKGVCSATNWDVFTISSSESWHSCPNCKHFNFADIFFLKPA